MDGAMTQVLSSSEVSEGQRRLSVLSFSEVNAVCQCGWTGVITRKVVRVWVIDIYILWMRSNGVLLSLTSFGRTLSPYC